MSEAEDRIDALEDGYTERKPDGTSGSELRRTIVGFANSVPEGRNAILYLGVTNDGKILGVNNSDALQRTLRSLAEQGCYPPIRVTSEVLTIEGKHVIAVIVSHSSSRPHFSGHAYVRRGSETVIASTELFEELITSRHSKAGAILALKGQLITVIAARKNWVEPAI